MLKNIRKRTPRKQGWRQRGASGQEPPKFWAPPPKQALEFLTISMHCRHFYNLFLKECDRILSQYFFTSLTVGTLETICPPRIFSLAPSLQGNDEKINVSLYFWVISLIILRSEPKRTLFLAKNCAGCQETNTWQWQKPICIPKR